MTSAASSEARNTDRLISRKDITKKALGKKVDILVEHVADEFACAEAGKYQSTDSTKELVEGTLICPKTMRDMLCKLAASNPSKLNEITTVGYIFMGKSILHDVRTPLLHQALGLRMTCLFMTCPKGNVSRLQRIGPLEFPDDEGNFVSRMKALIRTVWKVRELLKSSLTIVSSDEEDVDPSLEQPARKCRIPTAYHHHQLPPPKRRKVTKSSQSSKTTSS